ncbi:Monoglyceride lipase, partial [Araneus ventricosus]
ALLLLSHGMTEHSMLYDSFAQEMVIKGFFVFAHDHIGHGYSDGSRAYINDVQELVEDSVSHIQMIRKEYPELPLFVCGHSMGGAVTVFLSLQVQISGMVLIAPALAANPETATFFTRNALNDLEKGDAWKRKSNYTWNKNLKPPFICLGVSLSTKIRSCRVRQQVLVSRGGT